MARKSLLSAWLLVSLALILASCNLSSGGSGAPSGPAPGAVFTNTPPAVVTGITDLPPTGDAIEILSVAPPVPAGISIADPVTVFIRYNMTIPEGTLQVWFERFADADCTATVADESGGTTMAGTLENAAGGARDVTVTVPPLPLTGAAYVGVGVRLWRPGNSSILVEDMSYDVCYAVKAPPASDVPAASTESEAVPGASGEVGAVQGTVFNDGNGSNTMDAGETGAPGILITLADTACGSALDTFTTDSAGNYSFFNIPPGVFCVTISYSGGSVLPGYFQRVTVTANHTSWANFALQSAGAGSAPPPSGGGYCGDGTVQSGLGEQCDPPNLTDCTASCQTYAGYCGNGIVDPALGEQCDPPNVTDCTASCQTYVAWCGDGYVDPAAGEQCDPPNVTDCTASCQTYTPVCGDGYVDTGFGEQCDPPNVDYCTAQCELYLPNCGNGAVETGEECDPPNTTNCTAQCQNWP